MGDTISLQWEGRRGAGTSDWEFVPERGMQWR
jgi:hypothetical protein